MGKKGCRLGKKLMVKRLVIGGGEMRLIYTKEKMGIWGRVIMRGRSWKWMIMGMAVIRESFFQDSLSAAIT